MIDNSWLKIATSKNYHHFFPKAYMRKMQPEIEDWKVNNIVNITIVDAFLNKGKIKANPPSKYMKEYIRINDKIESTIKTHLIGDFTSFGILENNFEKFISYKAKLILERN